MIGKVLIIGVAAGFAAHIGGMIRSDVVAMQAAQMTLVKVATEPNGGKARAGIQSVILQLRGLQANNTRNRRALAKAAK